MTRERGTLCGAAAQEYARSVAAAACWRRGEDGDTVASGMRMRMAALGADRRFEEAAQLRDAVRTVQTLHDRQQKMATAELGHRDVFGG